MKKIVYLFFGSIIITQSFQTNSERTDLAKLKSSGERISVVVLPFENMTNGTLWNIWQDAIRDILITSLLNS